MRTHQSTIIEPSVIKWARESIAMDISDAAKKADLSENILFSWESGETKPTFSQLEKLSDIYKRPLAVFFLKTPPSDLPLPQDYRHLPAGKKPFSTKTLIDIRRIRYIQSLFIDISNSLSTPISPKIKKINLNSNPDKVAEKLRNELNVNIKNQFELGDENHALSYWKRLIENQGILVLEISMPLEEGRGFSFADERLPIIVLNSKDFLTGKIFTLFHELGHILLNNSGICDMSLYMERLTIEKFCNRFSGAFLVPKVDLKIRFDEYMKKYVIDKCYEKLAKDFKVSRHVILRRLLIAKLISKNDYENKIQEIERELKNIKPARGRTNPSLQCIKKNGKKFVSFVLDAYKQGKITLSDASDYLGVKINHFPKVEQLIQESNSYV
ncbi:MAG: ImmA/IrrE family metallo-endopeptidase [Deltaproteobacteria bacterium]|nr:ImmA/IrrE family metallo-endopeptidase [Deltaproteobacteria bacterium]